MNNSGIKLELIIMMGCAEGGKTEYLEKKPSKQERPNKMHSHGMRSLGIEPVTSEVRDNCITAIASLDCHKSIHKVVCMSLTSLR